MKDDFYVGAHITYIGSNHRIGRGTTGMVIGLRERSLSGCDIAVKFDGKAGDLSDLNGLDTTHASLWCNLGNLRLDEDETWMGAADSTDLAAILA